MSLFSTNRIKSISAEYVESLQESPEVTKPEVVKVSEAPEVTDSSNTELLDENVDIDLLLSLLN